MTESESWLPTLACFWKRSKDIALPGRCSGGIRRDRAFFVLETWVDVGWNCCFEVGELMESASPFLPCFDGCGAWRCKEDDWNEHKCGRGRLKFFFFDEGPVNPKTASRGRALESVLLACLVFCVLRGGGTHTVRINCVITCVRGRDRWFGVTLSFLIGRGLFWTCVFDFGVLEGSVCWSKLSFLLICSFDWLFVARCRIWGVKCYFQVL